MTLPRVLIAAALIATASPALALDKLITVTGEASVSVTPDLAKIHAGVATRAKTASEASEANNRQMNAVMAALKDAGLPDNSVQTRRLTIHPIYDRGKDSEATVIAFQASNQVTVTVRDISRLSATLDRVIAAGANDVSGIEFSVSDASKQLDRARGEAIDDARRKAEFYAKAANVKLGPAVSIQENGASMPQPVMMARAAPQSTPVAPGEQTLRASVSVSYELK